MKTLIRRLIKFFAYLGATIVIVLAIAVGLFRLFLPRVPEYQDEIKAWASTAIGVQVEFSGMDARWGLSGPELEFYEAELIQLESGERIVAAEEVRIGVGLMRLMFEQSLVVDRVVIRETSVDVRQLEDGSFRVQELPIQELISANARKTDTPDSVEFVGEDIELRFIQPGDERPRFFAIPQVTISVDDKRIAVDANIRLPQELGRQLAVSATHLLSGAESRWDVIVDAVDIDVAGWSKLAPGEFALNAGTGDLELALSIVDGRLASATAELELAGVLLDSDQAFDVAGRVEVAVSDVDWLFAADDLQLSFSDHKWPESNIRVEASVNRDGGVVVLDTRASYLNLSDLPVFTSLLNSDQQAELAALAPTGVVSNLIATISDIDTEKWNFDISAELDDVGVAAFGSRPGISGFSGLVRANRSGGRIEIDSDDVAIAMPELLDEIVNLRNADGTIIWRSSNDKTTILTDSIVVSSDVFYSQSNIQLVLNNDGSSPEIDLASTWSISDIAEAKRFIPRKGLSPKLFDWFQMALVSGSITRGTTALNGPLDKFPFDGGEGRLLMEASVRDMTFKYHQQWPATEQSDMEVVLDNARLYTSENSSVSSGIAILNADVNIPDLRDPVLSIQSFSTGNLQSIREFSVESPISKVFGGQLDRVSVSGEASFNLDLTVPLKGDRLQEFEFVARIRSNNGTLAIEGFPPPITDLIGEVTIERTRISSEGLGARFLGQEINISLERSEDPLYAVVAIVDGTISADGIVDDLGAPIEGLIDGLSEYEARILFPNGKSEIPSALTIQIDSDLQGMSLDFPEPLGKPADVNLAISGDIRFLPGGKIIESSGIGKGVLAWQLAFNRPEGYLDFDRGMLALGGATLAPADTRGLHIRGSAAVVRLQDWLNLSRSGESKVGAADRIRSIDITVDDLYLFGQRLQNHRVRVDRSARDWLVQFDGEDVAGSVFVPYDFAGDRAMIFDMQKLRLPGGDDDGAPATDLDPRTLPPIQLKAAQFAFGDRYLGSVEVQLDRTPDGLEAASISSVDDSFRIEGSGRWVADSDDPLGSHTSVAAKLTSTNVETTMRRLNYEPGIVSDAMTMSFDLDWSGSPRADFFDVLDGSVQVRLGNGQLEEVEPGAGRMFGLMSIVALPRRLSLDFRDVFSKGFGFDKITGTFTIESGITSTCDLSLEGPAADIGIVGQADLSRRVYEQTAIVSANVGNTLPIVGAVVAGPQVAAALLIFSQIFKKPLKEVGQVYYGISGSWDEPAVESANLAAFVASGELAGCLAEGE